MMTPIVKELPLKLEPITGDDFIDPPPRPLPRAARRQHGRSS
jgi:hypothetical protein